MIFAYKFEYGTYIVEAESVETAKQKLENAGLKPKEHEIEQMHSVLWVSDRNVYSAEVL